MRLRPMRGIVAVYAVLPLLALVSACSRDEPVATPTASTPATTAGTTAAASNPSLPQAAPAVSNGPNLATLRGYIEAWNGHDSRRAAEFLTEDSEYFDAAFAGRQTGRAAIEEKAIAVFMRGLPDLQWQMRSEPIVDASGIAYEWTLTGTNSGTWGGIPATNQKISLKGMSFVRFRDGKISYQAVVYDSATLNRQLGL